MPVSNSVVSSGLRVMVQVGTNVGGLAIIRARNFTGIKPQATDEAVYNVGVKIGELQEHPVSAIRRIIESELSSQ
jgi:hypothetical protein